MQRLSHPKDRRVFPKWPPCVRHKLPEGRDSLNRQLTGPLARCLTYSRCLITTCQVDGRTEHNLFALGHKVPEELLLLLLLLFYCARFL